MNYTWQIAPISEFEPIRQLFLSSDLGKNSTADGIRRRITIPLLQQQVISFHAAGKLCGFVSFAFLNTESEKHMQTCGILAQDWKSGDRFWVVDYVVAAGYDGYKMLRMVTREMGIKKACYFRDKHQEIREVRA